MSPKARIALTVALVAVAAVAGFLAGRSPSRRGLLAVPDADGLDVAEFRGWALPAATVAKELSAQPARVKEALRSPEARKAYVEGVARTALFAREAERRGLQLEPAFLRRYEEELAKTFVEKELEAAQRQGAPTDEEVRRWFDENATALGRPERARIATVAYLAGDADAAARAAKQRAAERGLSAALRRRAEPYAFAELARTESEDLPARATNGELPFATREELAQRFGPELAEAAFATREAGTVVPRVVETPRGFYLVKLVGREAAYAPAFEDVKDAIRSRLAAERRAKAYEALVQRLSREAGVRLDEKAIADLKIE